MTRKIRTHVVTLQMMDYCLLATSEVGCTFLIVIDGPWYDDWPPSLNLPDTFLPVHSATKSLYRVKNVITSFIIHYLEAAICAKVGESSTCESCKQCWRKTSFVRVRDT